MLDAFSDTDSLITQVALSVRWLDHHRNAYSDREPYNEFLNVLAWWARLWIIDETFREANRRNAEVQATRHLARRDR
jgi:hypothetical protein